MKIYTEEQVITSSSNAVEKQMTVNADEVFWEALSSTIYSTTRWVTEYAQNASDVDKNWRFHLPSVVNPYCLFIDNGPSMSKDFMLDQGEYDGCGFCTAFSSTKRDDNSLGGGFGIGRLTGPQGTLFECRNQDGYTRTYLLSKNSKNIPSIKLMAEVKSEKNTHTGVTVKVPVALKDINDIKELAQKSLQFFEPCPAGITPPSIKIKHDDFVILNYDSSMYNRNGASLIVGGYLFPLDRNALTTYARGKYDDAEFSVYKFNELLMARTIVLKLPVGSVDIALSRETLKYSDRTCEAIYQAADSLRKSYIGLVQEKIDLVETEYEAMCEYAKICKGFNISTLTEADNFKYKGSSFGYKNKLSQSGLYLGLDCVETNSKDTYRNSKISAFSGNEIKPQITVRKVDLAEDHIFMINDDASMPYERIGKYIKDTGTESLIYVFDAATPDALAQQLAMLRNPPTIKLSTLDLPERLPRTAKVKTNKNNSFFRFYRTDLSSGDSYYDSMICNGVNRCDKEIDLSTLDDDIVWVPTLRKEPETVHFQDIITSPLFKKASVYGVPKSDRKLVEPTWIEFKDYAATLVGDLTELGKYIHLKHLNTVRKYTNVIDDFIITVGARLDIKEFTDYNDIVMWLTSFIDKDKELRVKMAHYLSIDIPEWKPAKDINLTTLANNIKTKYPMADLLSKGNFNRFTEKDYRLIEASIRSIKV